MRRLYLEVWTHEDDDAAARDLVISRLEIPEVKLVSVLHSTDTGGDDPVARFIERLGE